MCDGERYIIWESLGIGKPMMYARVIDGVNGSTMVWEHMVGCCYDHSVSTYLMWSTHCLI